MGHPIAYAYLYPIAYAYLYPIAYAYLYICPPPPNLMIFLNPPIKVDVPMAWNALMETVISTCCFQS